MPFSFQSIFRAEPPAALVSTLPPHSNTSPRSSPPSEPLSLLVAFLQSPLWLVPLDRYIDSHCLAFTPNSEHSFSHTSIHLAYVHLAETLLTNHLPSLSIKPPSLPSLLSTALSSPSLPLATRRTLEHLLTLDDYLVFHTRMVQRNVELEQQVLQEVVRQEKGWSAGGKAGGGERKVGRQGKEQGERVEEREMRMAMELSMLEEEGRKKEREKEEAELQYAIALSLALQAQQDTQLPLDLPRQPSTPPVNAESLPRAKLADEEEKEADDQPASGPVVNRQQARSARAGSLGPLKGIRRAAGEGRVVEREDHAVPSPPVISATPAHPPLSASSSSSSSSSGLTPAEVQAKVEFLRAQRDILIARKQRKAEEELKEFEREVEEGEEPMVRPEGEGSEQTAEAVRKAAMRRRLQERLREEAEKTIAQRVEQQNKAASQV